MSVSLPQYTRLHLPRLGRRQRVLAMVTTGVMKEIRRTSVIFALVAGILVTTVTSLVLLLFSPLLLQGQPLNLTFFALPASNAAILFFATLLGSVVGGGLIADDRASGALSLYLSRPITALDYLGAKASILGILTLLVTFLPLAATALAAPLLGFLAWDISLTALGLYLGLGLLLASFFTAVALFLSSLTARRGYAAAGVFFLQFGLTLPAQGLAGALRNPGLLYLSPWEDFSAVARAAFGVSASNTIDAAPALTILLVVIAVALFAAYRRITTLEVTTP